MELQKNISDRSEQLSQITEVSEDLCERIEDRQREINEVSVLSEARRSIRTLRDEIVDMNVRIGYLRGELMRRRVIVDFVGGGGSSTANEQNDGDDDADDDDESVADDDATPKIVKDNGQEEQQAEQERHAAAASVTSGYASDGAQAQVDAEPGLSNLRPDAEGRGHAHGHDVVQRGLDAWVEAKRRKEYETADRIQEELRKVGVEPEL